MQTRRRVFWLWCAILAVFGYLIASWIYQSLASGQGIVQTASDVFAMVSVVAVANAKALILGPKIFAALKILEQ